MAELSLLRSQLMAAQLDYTEDVICTPPRLSGGASDTAGHPSGALILSYFTAPKDKTYASIMTATRTQAAGATPSICRMAVYEVAANGDLTLSASTPNDTSLWSVINSEYERNFSSPFAARRGQRYAAGYLCVTAAAIPNLVGASVVATSFGNSLVRLNPPVWGRLLSQTDLPNSVPVGSILGIQQMSKFVIR